MSKNKPHNIRWGRYYYFVWEDRSIARDRDDDPAELAKRGMSRMLAELLSSFSLASTPRDSLAQLKERNKRWKRVKPDTYLKWVELLISRKFLAPLPASFGFGSNYPAIRPVIRDRPIIFRTAADCFTNSDIHEFVEIGKYCSLADGIEFFLPSVNINHDPFFVSTYSFHDRTRTVFPEALLQRYKKRERIIIRNDVWIGSKAAIMSGISIGNGAVIAAHSVVTSNVPDYAIFGGNPARLLRYRFAPEIINKLLEILWWDWPQKKIQDNHDLFAGGDIAAFIAKHGRRTPNK